jgi:ABC-type lipoprotein export system ATPase subunit
MNLAEFTVKNYKRLRGVKLVFDRYTALIGENGSGKTSILEALLLFFKDFSVVGGTPPPALQDVISWHNKKVPIEFIAKIVLSQEECRDMFPQDLLDRFVEKSGEGNIELTILRRIPKLGAAWETVYMDIAGISLVKDNTIVSPDELTKSVRKLARKRPSGIMKAYLFDANQLNLVGNRLVVLKNKAYHTDDYVDTLIREGKIPFEQLPGTDYEDWVKSQGLELVEATPAKSEIDTLLSEEAPLITNEILQNAQNKIAEKIKGKLKLIPATRDERVEPGERGPFLSMPTIVNPLRSLDATDYEAWYEIGTVVEGLIEQRLSSVPQLSTWEKKLRLPINLIGGGQQEIIGLVYQVYTAVEPIIAIEEPETHLHHNLSRKLFEVLKELATRKQLIVATHSEYFAEVSDDTKNWFLEKKDREVEPKEIKTKADLLKAFGSLGAEPSDRGYPNKILFVGGETEEGVLPIWTERLGVDIKNIRVEALEGEYDKRKIKIINDYIKEAQTSVFLMVDGHASDKVKQAVDEEHKLVLKGTIEDCYPIPILIQVLNENFGLELTEGDIDPKQPRVEEIKRLLNEKSGIPKAKTLWKRPIGKEVAEQMSKDDIPEEIKDFIVKMAN